jgi:hypothetical protein
MGRRCYAAEDTGQSRVSDRTCECAVRTFRGADQRDIARTDGISGRSTGSCSAWPRPRRENRSHLLARRVVPNDFRVIVARQQRQQRRRSLGRVRRSFSLAPVTMGYPSFSSCPPWTVAIGRPEGKRSASHVAEMLNQPERIEVNIIDGTRRSVPRHPRFARSLDGELQYRCNRCLSWHSRIVAHLR